MVVNEVQEGKRGLGKNGKRKRDEGRKELRTHRRIRMVQKVFHRVAGLRERLFEYPCHCGNGAVVVSTVGDDLPKR